MLKHLSQPNKEIHLNLDFVIHRKLDSKEAIEIPWSYPYTFELEPIIKGGKPSWKVVPPANDDEFIDEQYFDKWTQSKAHTSRFLTDWEAVQIFKENIYGICMDKISNNEQAENFKEVLNKSRSENKLDIQSAKAFPMEELLRRYGYDPRLGAINCPFHDDSSPSLSIYKKTNRWKCFGCQSGGDTIDFVMRKQNVSFVEAIKILN